MGRELRRVPLDFDWPLKQVWKGYRTPPEYQFPTCPDCDGEGYGPEARAVANTFYAHRIGGHSADDLAWHDKLGQAEVDYLVEKGRLRVWRGGEWHTEPRTAAEVNEINRRTVGLDGHDAINRMLLVEFRCKVLGIEEKCPTCGGHGSVATDEQREAADAHQWTEPPTGEGYQLWETTSEGSPISPVFDTLDALCNYAADHCTTFGDARVSASQWRSMLDEGFVRHEVPGAVFI